MSDNLRIDALQEIYNDQLEPIASLSGEQRIQLWHDIQVAWSL